MKIMSKIVSGFRAFEDQREIQFDDRLTLVAAANSHGKTSTSEAFERRPYGQTSKVERADSNGE
jgi:hypothetical protein